MSMFRLGIALGVGIGASLFSLTGARAQPTDLPADAREPVERTETVRIDPALGLGDDVTITIRSFEREDDLLNPRYPYNFVRAVGAAFWNRPFIYWNNGSYDGPQLVGRAATIEQAPVLRAPRPEPADPLERVDALLREGDFGAAAEALAPMLEAEPDRRSLADRMLVARLGRGDARGAAETLGARWRSDPDSAGWAPPVESILMDPMSARRLRRLAVTHAQRAETADAWLLVAALMADSGLPRRGVEMVDRAQAAGLDAATADRIRAALAPGGG